MRKFRRIIGEEGWEMNEKKSGIIMLGTGGNKEKRIEGIEIV